MANKTVIDGIAGLEALAGKDLGKSEWRTMKYEDIVLADLVDKANS